MVIKNSLKAHQSWRKEEEQEASQEISLVVQWLGFCAQYRGPELDSWLGNQISHAAIKKSYMPHTKIEDPSAATKTWHKYFFLILKERNKLAKWRVGKTAVQRPQAAKNPGLPWMREQNKGKLHKMAF